MGIEKDNIGQSEELARGMKSAAVALSDHIGAGLPGDGEQLPLIPLPLDASASEFVARYRGVGRPAGAKNKRTERMIEYMERIGPDPLLAMQQIFSMPVERLATDMACTKLEALKVQVTAMKELAPYWYAKQSPEAGQEALAQLTITIEKVVKNATPDEKSKIIEVLADDCGFEDENDGGENVSD